MDEKYKVKKLVKSMVCRHITQTHENASKNFTFLKNGFVLFHQGACSIILKELSYIYFSSRFVKERYLIQKRYSKRYSGFESADADSKEREREKEREKSVPF